MNQLNLNKIKNRYLLYVGNSYPHKNLDRLVSAFEIVIKNNPDLLLILVGKIDYFYQRLEKLVRDLNLEHKIIFTGAVSDQELNGLYQNAIAYVFPSLAEGFGLPGLEAMARGCPVISSKADPLPEIYGRAAVYFNPYDINEMAEVIHRVISDNDLREKIKQFGLEQAKKYSWQECAQKTLDIYREISK